MGILKSIFEKRLDPRQQAVETLKLQRMQDPNGFRLDMADATRNYENNRNQLGYSHPETRAAQDALEFYKRANGGQAL